ncbi:MAG: thymidylate synthase [Candidatus Peregrinibacteria bacterium]
MKQYLELVQEVLESGEKKDDRTGTGTLSIFGVQKRYDLREGFPMVTTKKVSLHNVIAELLWFLSGCTNIHQPVKSLGDKSLHDVTKIWDDWADEKGELGPIYGHQWVNWPGPSGPVNQVQQAIDLIKNDPKSRRIIVSAWNPGDLPRMALAPCHMMFQFNVANGFLDCQLYQRSADIALGVPYNIASYSALLMMMAQECRLKPRYFIHTFGDAHIYFNHVEGLRKQVTRTPHPLPTLKIAPKPFWEITANDFELVGYEHDDVIKFPIAV